MSIYARKYKPSKWEPIVFADKLDDMFTDFAARDFGIKNMNRLVRSQYVNRQRKNNKKNQSKTNNSYAKET